MRLLDFPQAPNPRRVRIFVAEKGIDLPTVPVDVPGGENRGADFLAKNPWGGLLPVLELDDGTHLAESVAICRYLEALHPDPPLLGVDAQDAAVVEMWNRRMELELFRNVGDYFRNSANFFADRFVQHEASAEQARRFAVERMGWLDASLADRPFVAGERFTIADITAWVSLDLGMPTVFDIPPELGHLRRWFDDVSKRPTTRA